MPGNAHVSDDSKNSEEDSPKRAESARQLASTAGLFVAVLALLGLGAVLAVDPKTEPKRPEPASIEAPTPQAPPVVIDATPAPVEEMEPPVPHEERAVPPAARETTTHGLASRAASDARRLAKGGGVFTLQLLVACKEETVERYLNRAAGSSSLYLLPASVKGQSCYRVSFGSYASAQEAAAAASGVPSELRSGAGSPSPKKIADLLL